MATTDISELLESPTDLCSDFAFKEKISPTGTGLSARRLVLIDAPSSWPANAVDHEYFKDNRGVMTGPPFSRTRRLLTVEKPGQRARLQVFDRIQETTKHIRLEFDSPSELASNLAAISRNDTELEFHDLTEPLFLVCSHSERDFCCGSKGQSLAETLLNEGINVEQVSHLGGHRYAPTMLSLPDGNSWAYATKDLVNKIITNELTQSDFEVHGRGWWGAKAEVQQICVLELQKQGIDPAGVQEITSDYDKCTIRTDQATYSFAITQVGIETIPQCQIADGGTIKSRKVYKAELHS